MPNSQTDPSHRAFERVMAVPFALVGLYILSLIPGIMAVLLAALLLVALIWVAFSVGRLSFGK
jgi:hypothetical protein